VTWTAPPWPALKKKGGLSKNPGKLGLESQRSSRFGFRGCRDSEVQAGSWCQSETFRSKYGTIEITVSTENHPNPARYFCVGVSLPEVLTVIVIVGILSAMAVPRFLRFTATSRLEDAAQLLAKNMEWTKLAGTRSGVKHYMRFRPGADTSWYEIWMENSDPIDNLFSSADDSLLRRIPLDPSVRFGGLDSTVAAPTGAPGGVVPSNGLGDGLALESCRDDGLIPGQGSWSSVVAFCGGTKAAMEAGAVYLSLKNYPELGETIVFDDDVSFKFLKYAWRGSWSYR